MSDERETIETTEQQPRQLPFLTVQELHELLDAYAPEWQRPAQYKGKRLPRRLSAERDAVMARRAHLREVLQRALAVEQENAVVKLEASNLRNLNDRYEAERDEAKAEFDSLKVNLPIILQVATQVAAAAGVAVTGVEYSHRYYRGAVRDVQINYWLAGQQVPVMHGVSNQTLLHGTGRDEASFVLSQYGGISDGRLRGLHAFHARSDDCDYCGRRTRR